ncbi:hypothetical protein O181_021410 [Austropuccinia psidii MF-1]|uniref:Uncharacterized protein n=1 Tax=Austropuccinia psidii MF-1 TaxID=1389203 RepID=A0A9Q3CFP3_9BASI|nr:hypothetical protein [Austropuccinia psidii MF-1]
MQKQQNTCIKYTATLHSDTAESHDSKFNLLEFLIVISSKATGINPFISIVTPIEPLKQHKNSLHHLSLHASQNLLQQAECTTHLSFNLNHMTIHRMCHTKKTNPIISGTIVDTSVEEIIT